MAFKNCNNEIMSHLVDKTIKQILYCKLFDQYNVLFTNMLRSTCQKE